MSALFVWPASKPRKGPEVGDRRVVTRFLLWPKKLEGEWRWLGFVNIQQQFQRYRVCPPEMKAMDVVGWRSVAWDRSHERMMEIRKLAAKIWLEDGGHLPHQNGGVIHEFMVQQPETRRKYEEMAEAARFDAFIKGKTIQ